MQTTVIIHQCISLPTFEKQGSERVKCGRTGDSGKEQEIGAYGTQCC